MLSSEVRKLFRKLFTLVALVACLTVVTTGTGTKASTDPSGARVLPCCSVCDDHPQFCTHGCICCGGVC
jgi:hypothetical protein